MAEIIIFPTDTVYGIGCQIFDCESIEKIYKIKKRDKSKPLACLCADFKQIESVAEVSEVAAKLIKKFMPGPLTVILPTKEEVFAKINYRSIGVRIPASAKALELLIKMGPLLTTSVNESGSMALNDFEEIKRHYSTLVDKIYPPQQSTSGTASTVVDLTVQPFKILRVGTISELDIINALK